MIRVGTNADIPDILRMMRAFHGAYGLGIFPADEQHARRLVVRYLNSHDTHLVLVAEDEITATPCALLMALAGPYDFAPLKIATERLWWVDPEARGRVAVNAMVQLYESWARDQGCAVATMSGLTANPAAGMLYARRGYVSGDTTWLKRL